jgi:hypothetical protein
MAREPSYPDDAPVGRPKAEAGAGPTGSEAPAADNTADTKRNRHLMTGAAIGIGSAALVAALLYANRGKKGERN